jgi:hypothetical protein
MVKERLSGFSLVALAILGLSAILVFTRFGWFTALNAAIPLAIALLWLIVLALSAWGAGDLVCRRWFGPDDPPVERCVVQLLTGTAVLAAAAGLLGFAHILGPFTLLVVLGGFCCHGALRIFRQDSVLFTAKRPAPNWVWIVVVIAGGVSLAAATTFAPFYDQWHYHLAFPYHWLRTGSLVTFPRQAYSFFPSNMGLIYVYGLAGPGAWAAQIAHWWMGALTAAGAASIAKRLGAPADGQVLAAAVFLATPSVVQLGALAGADLGVAAFSTGAVIALLRMHSDPGYPIRWAMTSGAFAGFAAGAKYLAIASVVVPTAVAAALIAFSGAAKGAPRAHRPWRSVLAFVIAVAVVVGPWLVRNAVQTGNPVYPYFADVFARFSGGLPGTDDQVAAGIGNFSITGRTLVTALTLGTFDRRGHAGDIGPAHLWLLPLICLFVWRHRRDPATMVVFAVLILGIAIWASGPPLGRYLLPPLALSAALAGVAWKEIVTPLGTPIRQIFGGLLLLVLLANCNPIRGEYLRDQLACFLGLQTDEEYLQLNCTQLEAFRTANEELPAEARVLLVGEPRAYGIDRDIVVEDQFRKPLLVEIAEQSSSPTEIKKRLRSLGITHLLWNGAEAQRIAFAEERTDFLACSSAEARARLDQFLAESVVPVAGGRSWEIGAFAID